MTELSPTAKIILVASAKANCLQEWDHVNDPPCHPDDSNWNGCYTCIHRAGIAAALRAAVDQAVPEYREHYPATLDERYRKVSAFDVRNRFLAIATQAAQWGSDQELEKCCAWLDEHLAYENNVTNNLRAARRPKPPSLKEQALAVIENSAVCDHLSPEHEDILLRALEQLDD